VVALWTSFEFSQHSAEDFRRAAHLVYDPEDWSAVPEVTPAERRALERETTHPWDQPFPMSVPWQTLTHPYLTHRQFLHRDMFESCGSGSRHG